MRRRVFSRWLGFKGRRIAVWQVVRISKGAGPSASVWSQEEMARIEREMEMAR